ncbi:MAG: type II toxin-antitoxin system RelE/ParE family toxin [Opitutaceae bacterium]|nr:type II toxin-antitoxin system RelE/ParE family toxin [Opitutaceae bacterium]
MMFLSEIAAGNSFRLYAIGSEGRSPCHDFLTSIQTDHPDEWAKLMARLQRAADHGPPLSNPEQCRKLKGSSPEDTVYEFKTHQLRLFWFYDQDRMILCSNGLLKGTRKEQDRAIAIARRWKADYLTAKSRGRIQFPRSP